MYTPVLAEISGYRNLPFVLKIQPELIFRGFGIPNSHKTAILESYEISYLLITRQIDMNIPRLEDSPDYGCGGAVGGDGAPGGTGGAGGWPCGPGAQLTANETIIKTARIFFIKFYLINCLDNHISKNHAMKKIRITGYGVV
jgi:hypothetical protein